MRTRCSAVLLAVLLTGCTSSPDEPSPAEPTLSAADFSAGACAPVADDVIAVGDASTRLGDGGMVAKPVRDALRESQGRLSTYAESATAEVRPALDGLVVAIGLVRIRADGNTYETALGAQLRKAYDTAVTACTAPAPAASPAPVIEVTLPPDLTESPAAAPTPSG